MSNDPWVFVVSRAMQWYQEFEQEMDKGDQTAALWRYHMVLGASVVVSMLRETASLELMDKLIALMDTRLGFRR